MSQLPDLDLIDPRPMGHLPNAVGALFDAASTAGFRVKEGREQVMLSSGDGTKVGGWNKNRKHWYVSRIIATGHEALMRRHRFKFKDRSADDHGWWQIRGADNAVAFRSVCEALTGERIGVG